MVCAIIVPWDCLLRNLFYLYIPIGCLDSSLLLQTEGDSCYRRSFAVLVRRPPWFCSSVNKSSVGDRTDYMEAAGYLLCGNPLSRTSLDGWSLRSVFVWGYVFVCIYNALQHFNIIYSIKGNGRITRMRQSMLFFTSEILSGTSSSVFICIGTAPQPVVIFSVTTLSICLCTHNNNYSDTLKDLTLYYFRASLLNFTLKILWIKLLFLCKLGLPDTNYPPPFGQG